MVDVLVDLLGVTVLPEQTSQNAGATHPENASGHTGFAGTLSLTTAVVATFCRLADVSTYLCAGPSG